MGGAMDGAAPHRTADYLLARSSTTTAHWLLVEERKGTLAGVGAENVMGLHVVP